MPADELEVHVLWMNGGLSCDGESVALTAATQPTIEEIALGGLPGLPKVALHWPMLAYDTGPGEFIDWFHKAARGELDPFILVIEGSIPNEAINGEGYWSGFGNDPDTGNSMATAQPMTANRWLDLLAPKADIILAAGTCSAYGGIHAMAGNPTGAMGVADYLGWDWKSKAGVPIVNLPGCPAAPDSLAETIMYLLQQVNGVAPMIPLDEVLRPTWLFRATAHEGCNRAGFYEEGEYATGHGVPRCLVKLGCWGPAVTCSVPSRGWINGIGGCPNVGGICIGCTMPGFPDMFMPFMDEPRGVTIPGENVRYYTGFVRELRRITNRALDREPPWRRPSDRLLSGYEPPWQ
jgi:hydrogenase small subunit